MTFRGIATNVNFVNLHALDMNGVGTDSTVINAINAAINLKSKYNIRVINLSLGRPVYESYTLDPLCQAVEKAYKAGIVVVVTAGNDGRDNSAGTQGYGTITAPGNDPYVITVGAMKTMGTLTRTDDVIASYSSKGPTSLDHIVKPDIVAPGNRVVSLIAPAGNLDETYPSTLVPLTYYEATGNTALSNNYYRLSGTSMAAGVVSGAAVLLVQKNPALTPDQVKARLMKTAYKNLQQFSSTTDSATGTVYYDQADVFTVGAGYLDIQSALSDNTVATLPASSPTAYFDSTTRNAYFISDQHALWGSSTSWGLNAVWGNNAFDATQAPLTGSNALWGNHALWGSSGTSGFNALWGAHALWGSSAANLSELTTVLINGEN